jgi:arylsulfatase A-like enzyme
MTTAAGPRNVLLIVLDSVRAANCSLYGYDRGTTPVLESMATEAEVYEQARSPGTDSVASHTSMFTGLHVREHGVTGREHRLKPEQTVWETLADRGYATGVFSNNPFLTELNVGLRDAFGTVVGRERELPYPGGVNIKNFVIDASDGPSKYLDLIKEARRSDAPIGSLVNGVAFKCHHTPYERILPRSLRIDPGAERYAGAFLDWQADRDDPWAACVNLMDAHFPYAPGDYDRWADDESRRVQHELLGDADQAWSYVAGDRPWAERERLVDLYDGAIRRADAAVGRIVDALRDRSMLDDTLLVVTADHGEGFGERSAVRPDTHVVGHGNGGVDEPLVHVPLLVRGPHGQTGTVTDPASLVAFPDIVRAALNGESLRRAFVTEPVVASAAGIDADTQALAREYGVDPAPFTERADGVYVEGPDAGIHKHERWGTDLATTTVRGSAAPADPLPEAVIESVLDDLSDAGVRTRSDSINAATGRQLERLGYR